MDPFIDPHSFSSIRSGRNGLASFSEGKGSVNTHELADALNSISRGLSQMQQQARGGPVRESDESLGRIGYAAQLLSEAALRLKKSFTKGDEAPAFATRRLDEAAEQVGSYILRLRSALRDYNRK